MMSNEELEKLVEFLIQQYTYCAYIHEASLEEWIRDIEERFEHHPLKPSPSYKKKPERKCSTLEFHRFNDVKYRRVPDTLH